ncbi:glutamate-cysteine ligase family protein [Streptomyces sp. LMG1-1-1.1]|uniref:glutamate-cysteine ligase family protein n=1 Tax=Streptomyces sp. LMG1-1-1.1 TaxID=3135245 RepID=UPI003465F791
MSETYRHVADERLIRGAQMHVDVPNPNSVVRALCVINPGLPPLPALSASSPYRLGSGTGHASRRSIFWPRRPTLRTAVDELIATGLTTPRGRDYELQGLGCRVRMSRSMSHGYRIRCRGATPWCCAAEVAR